MFGESISRPQISQIHTDESQLEPLLVDLSEIGVDWFLAMILPRPSVSKTLRDCHVKSCSLSSPVFATTRRGQAAKSPSRKIATLVLTKKCSRVCVGCWFTKQVCRANRLILLVMSLQSNSDKDKFLADVAFGIALAGTAQRGKVYRRESSADERKNFRSALRCALENLAQQYDAPVTDDRHVSNIDDLARTLSKQHPEALNASSFRIGSAQKALNLYLKMLWCFDRIPTPPHCPFDRVVLSRVPGCESVKWTQLDSLPEYERIVRRARSVSNGVSLADWELHLYTSALSAARVTSLGADAT